LTIGKQQPTDGPIYSIGCIGKESQEFLRLKVDISYEEELLFLIDTGADISLLKGEKLIEMMEFDPKRKMKVKCVDGIVEARLELSSSVPHNFHLVSKHVDIPCDRILGRDFLQNANANICYTLRTVTLNGETYTMVGRVKLLGGKEMVIRSRGQIELPPRAESTVRVPVAPGSPSMGVTNKYEIQEGFLWQR
jgi:hypothetical protein